jgi:dynein heavy chain, axonemal
MMFAEGFAAARPLSKKMSAIMELSQQQLSKQVRTGGRYTCR